MELITAAGARYELAEARRFTQPWEREASLRLRAGDDAVLDQYHRHGRLLDAGTVEQAEHSAARAWLADTLAGHRSVLLVDTNEQATRLSAALRAELVRLGLVEEHGVPLGHGGFAGVGDTVQARRNGWEIAGLSGNRRGPINRETYRVTAVRDDGALEVTTATTPVDRGHASSGLGERLVLPPAYVAQDLALGYACTVHAAQGLTVDTTHSVVTPRTQRAALYVAMSRGRESNTARVTTVTGVDDPARGRNDQTLHRDPVAVLATILDTANTREARSALATAAESVDEIGHVRTPAELLADAAQLAATERTATWLDQLTDQGLLTSRQRSRIAAEDGAATLTRALRRAELAGHDARRVLTRAATERSLDDARNVSNVLYSRIIGGRRFDPLGDSWGQWVPRVEDRDWQRYLHALAAAADDRADRLGRDTAAEQPAWAIEALGPIPADEQERAGWERRAGVVAAYRELSDHDDPVAALGPAPKPGQVEAYAAYRAAWRVLGRPEVDREELELSNGQLRMRVRAAEREAAWAPRYVGNELAGTHQAAARHRQLAAVRTAEATASCDPHHQAQLRHEAAQAAALANLLDARAEQLHALDDARARWLVHTAATRAAADRAQAELAARHTDADTDGPPVTAQEWLDAHRAADAAEDPYRQITEADLDHGAHAVERDESRSTDLDAAPVDALRDLRDVAAAEPPQVDEDAVRVPTADETADAIERAQRAIAEISAREANDLREAEQHRAHELTRWHQADEAVLADEAGYDDAAGREPPTLEPLGRP
jgi:hypothetical protein